MRYHGFKPQNWLIILLALAGVLLPVLANSRSVSNDTLVPYASVKKPLQPIEHRDALHYFLPAPYPKVGILIAIGSFMSPDANWTIIDLRTHTITRLTTTTKSRPHDKRYGVITGRADRHLTVRETNQIIRQANAVWNPEPNSSPPIRMLTDVTCDVVLFDRDDVLIDRGTACPDEGLLNVIESIKTPNLK